MLPICNDTRDCCLKVADTKGHNRCTGLAETFEQDGQCVFAKLTIDSRPYGAQPRKQPDTRKFYEKWPYNDESQNPKEQEN